jgi:hypothetical protein
MSYRDKIGLGYRRAVSKIKTPEIKSDSQFNWFIFELDLLNEIILRLNKAPRTQV